VSALLRPLRKASGHRTRDRITLAIGAMLLPLLALAEPAVTIKQVDLKATPASDAKSVATLPAQSSVDLVQRQGAWVQLKSGKNTGWAKLFDIRLGAAGTAAPGAKAGSGSSLGETLNLASGNRGASVTTGVRGLDADMLSKAVPNPEEYAALVGYASTKEQSTTFAKAGKLAPRTVEFFK
jgi:hypothetical protein